MSISQALGRLQRLLGRRTADPEAPYAEIEAVVQRCAALLRGGLPATRVWNMVAQHQQDAPEWRVLAVAWSLAEESGAPLAPVLDRFGEAIRELGRVSERRDVLLSGPKSTIRLVALLPPAAMLLASALGFDPFAAFGSPVGLVSGIAGVLLLLLGVRWAQVLARRVSDADWVAGWEFELVAIGIGGGAPPRHAMRRAVDAADLHGAEWVQLALFARDGPLASLIAQAERLGTPLGPALLAESQGSRSRARTELERAAERLGVGVLVPLGVCVLPAFVLLGVVPVLMAVVGGTGV